MDPTVAQKSRGVSKGSSRASGLTGCLRRLVWRRLNLHGKRNLLKEVGPEQSTTRGSTARPLTALGRGVRARGLLPSPPLAVRRLGGAPRSSQFLPARPLAGGRVGCGPPCPAVDIDPEDGPRWWVEAILRVLGPKAEQGASELRPGLERACPAVEPDPPEPRPVVLVVVYKDGHPRIGGGILQAAQAGGPLRLPVDGGVQHVRVEHKTEWNQVGSAVAADGCQPSHRSRGNARAHFFPGHDQILR